MHSLYRSNSPSLHSHRTEEKTIVVLGAGIVGACVALVLQRAGARVILIDSLPPGSETSYGNAGLISVDSCIPISLPGMVWQLPRWLLDEYGPLSIRPAYLPNALPWLIKWLWAGRRAAVLSTSVALHDLHRSALVEYETLLGEEDFKDLIRVNGQLHLWDKNSKFTAADRVVEEIRQRQEISISHLDGASLARRIPALSKKIQQGIEFDRNAHCINPRRLVQTLVKKFQALNGQLVHERVSRLESMTNGAWRLWTNAASRDATRVVLATGAYTRQLLTSLKISIPLEIERGYHVELPDPGVCLAVPFIDRDRAVAVTPMEHGLRFAGAVEFAGLEHPPNSRRIDALIAAAHELFPGIRTDGVKTWLGYRPSTPDSIPIIGPVIAHPGLFLACGHGHTGMTGAPMTAKLIAHHMLEEPEPIRAAQYALDRFL